jgi:hypothetical protein
VITNSGRLFVTHPVQREVLHLPDQAAERGRATPGHRNPSTVPKASSAAVLRARDPDFPSSNLSYSGVRDTLAFTVCPDATVMVWL